jgi:hypothetical protein
VVNKGRPGWQQPAIVGTLFCTWTGQIWHRQAGDSDHRINSGPCQVTKSDSNKAAGPVFFLGHGLTASGHAAKPPVYPEHWSRRGRGAPWAVVRHRAAKARGGKEKGRAVRADVAGPTSRISLFFRDKHEEREEHGPAPRTFRCPSPVTRGPDGFAGAAGARLSVFVFFFLGGAHGAGRGGEGVGSVRGWGKRVGGGDHTPLT